MSKSCFWALLVFTTVVMGRAEADFIVTANDPTVQATQVSGAMTENFEGFTANNRLTSLNTAVGTITSPGLAILAHDQYGGAGGTGQYISIGAQSGNTSMTVNLKGAESYFGIWWSAADQYNQIAFFSAGRLIGYLNSQIALNDLGSSYLGNPNTGQDSGEKFAYLNFIGTSGTTFDRVVFTNPTSTGWESDNWSIAANQPATTPGHILNGGVTSAVPEPSSLVMASMGFLGCVGLARRFRRQAR